MESLTFITVFTIKRVDVGLFLCPKKGGHYGPRSIFRLRYR